MQCAVLVTCQITLFLSPVAIPQLHPLPAFGSISTHFVTPPILVTGTPVFSPFSLPPATSPGRWKNSLSTDLRLQMQVLGHEHPQYLVEVPDPPEVQRGRIVPHLVPGLCHHVFFERLSLWSTCLGERNRDEMKDWHPSPLERNVVILNARGDPCSILKKNVDDRKKMIDPTWAPRYISGWLIKNWSETPWRLFCQTHFLWSASNSSQLPPADRTSHLFSRFLTTCSSRFWSFLTSWGFQLHERHVASTNQVEEDKYINSVKRNVLCLWYLSYISLPKCQWQILVLQIKSIQIQCWYKGMLTCPEDFPQLLCAEKPDQENDLILGQPRCNRIYLVFPVLRQSSWAIDGVCAGPSVTIF